MIFLFFFFRLSLADDDEFDDSDYWNKKPIISQSSPSASYQAVANHISETEVSSFAVHKLSR